MDTLKNLVIAREGTHTHTERVTRAHLPDGRIQDGEPEVIATDGDARSAISSFARSMTALTSPSPFPHGTTYEILERQVTVTATAWVVVPTRPKPTPRTPSLPGKEWARNPNHANHNRGEYPATCTTCRTQYDNDRGTKPGTKTKLDTEPEIKTYSDGLD